MRGHRASGLVAALAACVLLASVGIARAGTLTVAISGDDLVFTWDTGPDDLLRGTSPDDLRPWLSAVVSPLTVPMENAPRGEDAWYRLASGSNLALRLERTFDAAGPVMPFTYPITIPAVPAIRTMHGLFAAWPELVEIVRIGPPPARRPIAASRTPWGILGDDEPLPRALYVVFGRPTTVTIVGAEVDPDPGITPDELQSQPAGVPPHARWLTLFELACGERGVDWQDVNGDDMPDQCGRDTNGDGLLDSGLVAGRDPAVGFFPGTIRLTAHRPTSPPFFGIYYRTIYVSIRSDGTHVFGAASGDNVTLARGEAVFGDVAYMLLNARRPPTW